jgi:hypothetical protein
MKTFSEKYNTNKKRMYFLVAFVFLGFSGFAQVSFESSELNVSAKDFNSVKEEIPVKTSSVSLKSNINFILWFMGTKVVPVKTMSNEEIGTKNQIISTGIVPNHLLMKTLLKKTINLKIC